MNKIYNRLCAAFDVLFKKNVVVVCVYDDPDRATLWSTVDDVAYVGNILLQVGEYGSPHDDPTEILIFDGQNN
jgi:hypothetical protein